MEPPSKQQKTENSEIKEMLLNMQIAFTSKLKGIEEKIDKINSKYRMLEEKVENVLAKVEEVCAESPNRNLSLPCSLVDGRTPNYVIPNDEVSFPDGSWLGDPNNPEMRVRCELSPIYLENINSSCTTAEKMSLTLLDYLFDRETQAESNISGTGKHGKKQLDPLKIYGIKCHVTHLFGISNKDWRRIKQNIDSKCRTAFRRKRKGMPLFVKGRRERMPLSSKGNSVKSDESSPLPVAFIENCYSVDNLITPKRESDSFQPVHESDFILPLKLDTNGCSLAFADNLNSQIIRTEHVDIQVIQATEEQLEQLKQNHHIEILTEADILTDRLQQE